MTRLPYRIRPLADRDLQSHVEYLRERDPVAARRFVGAVFGAFDRIAENPHIGPLREFDSPGLSGVRLWPVPAFERWLIFYTPTDTSVQIVRILHGARDIPAVVGQ